MKRLFLSVGLLLCLGASMAQQPQGMEALRVPARANIISYDDENAIEHLRYDDSPYYLSVMEDWDENVNVIPSEYTQTYEFPKEWRAYRVFFRFQASPGYGFYVDDKLVGFSRDAGTVTEFDITDLVRFGKSNRLTLRFNQEESEPILEAVDFGLTGDCAILLKPLLNVQDYTLLADFDAASSTGSYSLEATLYNQRRKGKAYLEVELWDTKGKQVDKLGKWCFFDNRTESTHTISSSLPNVLPWTAETPRLYTAVIRLYDEKMELQDIVGTRFGFRSVTYKDGLTVNGRTITLKGITNGGFDHPLTADQVKALRADMVQMKCHNINAIRTAGFIPEDPKFYELCDELGFYVIVDANIVPGQNVATDNENVDLFVNRVHNLYGRYKNHTSIIAWSLGESLDNGVCMIAAYKALRQLDPARPVLYAAAQYAENTDLIAPVQCNTELLRQYLAKAQSRPLVMLSCGNAEGNTFGGMEPLWQMVRDHNAIQGGFVDLMSWYAIIDRPYMAELKHLYRPFNVRMTSVSADAAEFDIANLCDFRTLSDYKLDYVICTNLKPNIVAGDITMSLKPGETKDIKLKIPKLTLYAGEELFIQFTLRQRNNTVSIPKNTVLYTAQFPLPSENNPRQELAQTGSQPLSIEKDTLHQTRIYNNTFSVLFNDSLGTVTSLMFRGQPMLSGPVQLNFMRTPSPNDIRDPNCLRQWQRIGLDRLTCEVLATNVHKIDNYSVGIYVLMRYGSDKVADLFDVRQTYLILATGDVLLSNDITLSEQAKTIARAGLTIPFRGLDTVEWFGRNIESYIDRHAAGRIAQQSLPTSEMTYVYPNNEHIYDGDKHQHSGNRTEVRWLALRNGAVGLFADLIDTLCQFSVNDSILNLDFAHAGVGGADANMNLDESMLVKDHQYHFVMHLRPYDCMEYNAQDFRRIIYPKVVSAIIEMPVIAKSRDRFDGPMQVSIKCPTPKAEIRYTLDGSVPTEKSQLYTKPFTIQGSTVVRARAFKKGESPSFVATQQFTFDYIVSCTYGHKPNTPYNKNAARALFDGEQGDVNDLSHGWLGFSGHDVEVTLELGKSIHLSQVQLRFAHVPDAWVFAPAKVEVCVSSDGKEFSAPVEAEITYNPAEQSMNATQLQMLTVPVNRTDVRFVRIIATPIARIPAWHRAKGLNPWIMMDEIKIEEEIAR